MRRTDAITVSMSSGASERRSITSSEASASSAARQAVAQHLPPGDDGHVLAGAGDPRLAERQRLGLGRRRAST